MYLDKLNYDEKCSFIELAKIISKIDGETSFNEVIVINQYLKEIGFDENNEPHSRTLDEIIISFKDSSLNVKKIIIFELLILVYSDSKFCEKEEQLVDLLIDSFKINKKEYKQLVDSTNTIVLSLKEVNNIIFK